MSGTGRGDKPIDLNDAVFANAQGIAAEEQLSLGGDERLPWLESDDDDEEPGVDAGRMIAFAALGLVTLALILGTVWFVTRETPDDAQLANGGVIEAPEAPYKSRPADPGGREVAGTGDSSFAVAEGKAVAGQLADRAPPPAPANDIGQGKVVEASASPTPSGIGVQVGAYSTRTAAEAGWTQLTGRIGALQGRSHRVLQGTADSGTIYRLQAVAGTAEDADALCRAIRSQGGDCQVKR
jgi:hypothetical protein